MTETKQRDILVRLKATVGDGECFKNVAAGIQSIVISVGLVVAALWTYYTFSYQTVPALDVRVSAKPLQSPAGVRGLHVTVEFENKGNRSVLVRYDGEPILVQRLANDRDEVLAARTWLATPVTFYRDAPGEDPGGTFTAFRTRVLPDGIGVLPRTTFELDAYVAVDEPGVYMVAFQAPVRKGDVRDAAGFLSIIPGANDWHTKTYVRVD